ncbi:hypothetical protein L9F63_007681 [Diploptera punctata]|uniref:Uncharacterized protein n=1 Tax=Diploptera punctata TaxID=6984 RepID=A0AAD7Z825_DIPPU|nr:hypothetical protein L9F63_007681 [Diploptera punctata]
MYSSGNSAEVSGGQLTMGIIGCLPDNVQQAIKSFSIRDGRQHITLAFPFMEDLVKRFSEPPGSIINQDGCIKGGRFMWITPALLFDRCPEVIHGFETLVTLVPTTLRTSHPVGLLTVNQKGAIEGVKRHLESLVSILAANRTVHTLWNIPLVVSDLTSTLLEQVLEICSKRILEVHGDTLSKLYPVARPQELLPLVKSPQLDPAIRELWRVWSHEQVSSKVFPVCSTSSHLGSFFFTSSPQGEVCMVNRSTNSTTSLLGHVTHVPIKEGLHSVIKCLKNQDLAISPPSSPEEKSQKSRSCCACAVCRGESNHCRTLRRHEKSLSVGSLGQESAFHRPASMSSGQRYSLRTSSLCSSRYRQPESPQQSLQTPVPVVFNYYSSSSSMVAPSPPMCYRWRMFAYN